MSSRLVFLPLLMFAWGRVMTTHVEANDQPTGTLISHYNINYLPRQVAPPASSSNTILAPHPPLGLTTATPTASGPESSTSSVVDYTGTIAGPTAPSAFPTIIYITALPPSTSPPPSIPAKYRKRNRSRIHIPAILLSPYVMVPISAFLGFIQGIVFAWCCIRRSRTRKNRRARSASLEPGPPYVPIYTDENDAHNFDQTFTTLNLHDEDSPSKYSVHGSRYRSSQGSLWLDRAISGHSHRPESNSGASSLEKVFLWPGERNFKTEGDDPFLDPPSRATTTRTATTNMSFRTAEENTVPYDSQRHKSIRQAILERIRFGTFNRGKQYFTPAREQSEEVKSDKGFSIYIPSRVSSVSRTGTHSTHYSRRRDGHRQSDSDLMVGEVKRPERTYSPASSPRKEKSLVRSVGDKDDTEWVAGSGFRLVQEDPDYCSTPSKMSIHRRGHNQVKANMNAEGEVPGHDSVHSAPGNGRSPSVIRESVSGWLVGMDSLHPRPAEIDKYTILPVRKVPTKRTDGPRIPIRRSSKSRSRQNSRHSTAKILSRVDSSILPASPSQIMSPPLDSQLLFCSPFIPPSSSMPALTSRKGDMQTYRPTTETRASDEKSNKVHSSTPLPLPFAASPDTSPYRDLLVGKGFVADEGVSFHQADRHTRPEAEINVRSDASAARHAARQGAITKVDQIMLKGWSRRGVAETASQTMFGAVSGGENAMLQGGIQ